MLATGTLYPAYVGISLEPMLLIYFTMKQYIRVMVRFSICFGMPGPYNQNT